MSAVLLCMGVGTPVFAFVFTTSDVPRQLSTLLMVEYHEPVTLFRHV